MYLIYDENGELMRKIKGRAELKYLMQVYKDWSFKFVSQPRKVVDFSKFSTAPF
jgi:hypothetical protein